MENAKKDFFVSYNKEDKQWAKWIAGTLEANGYSCIVQAWNFRPGGNFVLNMHDALSNCERFIAVVSPHYMESLYCQAEWAVAFNKDPNSEKRHLIPVRVADFEPQGLLSTIIYIDLYGLDDKEKAEKQLINGVDTREIPRNRPSFPGSSKVRFPGSLPFNNLPFVRNEYFTGRDDVFLGISKGFESGNSISLTQTITGLGGVGKTQIALEYAYRHTSAYDYIWWISAEDEAGVIASYTDFARKMKLIDTQQDSECIIETVLNWLDTHNDWLFIYDNVAANPRDSAWWPRNNRGNIIVTTRDTHIDIGKKLDITTFSPDEAIAFLQTRTGIENKHAEAEKLAERLGWFPLALEQAAAYIRINEISFRHYTDLLAECGPNVLREKDGIVAYNRHIEETLQLSINKIAREDSRQLLNLCAYMAPENINPELFSTSAAHLPNPLQTSMSQQLEKNKALSALTQYSLLKKQGNGLGYSMHRLLQEIIKTGLEHDPSWGKCCISMLHEVYDFAYGNVESHQNFLLNTPHVEAVVQATRCNSDFSDSKTEEMAGTLCLQAGYGNYAFGNYMQALDWYRKASAIREKVLGTNHPSTAITYNNIASVYDTQGDYAQALYWYHNSLNIFENVLGTKHPNTATNYNNIALVYNKLGDYAEALDWHLKALAIREKAFGTNHPDTASTYNNMGFVYFHLGDYEEALEWHHKALVINEEILGTEHPDTAATYNNIAMVYSKQEDYTEALVWYRKALAICEKVLGTEHPHTASTYNNMASIYDNQGDYTEVLDWYGKALATYEQVVGTEHPDTATLYNNIGAVYDNQGDYTKAFEWYYKALTIREKVLGTEHPDTATTYNNMASVFGHQGDYAKALEWYHKALTILEKAFGTENPSTAIIYNNIGSVYDTLNNHTEALKWYRKASGSR